MAGDERRVHAIKRHINSAFTPSTMSQYESHVDESIRMVNTRISEHTPQINLVRWMELFAFDTMVRIAFSDGNFTENSVHDTIEGVKQRFEHWVQCYMRANHKDPEAFDRGTVVGMVISTIHAGAETVASTLLDTFRSLLENPTCMATLKKELEGAGLESPPTLPSVAKLPYLEAALKESMRLNSVNVAPMEREVPAGGAHIRGVNTLYSRELYANKRTNLNQLAQDSYK
ncbi:hypothetical protein FOBRF1_013817 [Fusarium oxysporum]